MNFKRKYRILLVDDNAKYLVALEMQLKSVLKQFVDYIDMASNGIEAIDKVKVKPYNIVFMDIDMPVLNGIESTKYIHKFYPHIHVVALSMHEEYFFINQMLSAGSHSFVTKDGLSKERVLKIIENFEAHAAKFKDIVD